MTDLYTSQRAMRNMRRAAMQRGVIAILDVGTSKIACLILRFDGPDRLREQASLVQHLNTELPGFVQFAAGFGAGHHVVGLLADGPCHLGTRGLQPVLGLITAQCRQGPRQHDGLARQRLRRLGGALTFVPGHAAGAQLLHHLAVVRLVKERANALRHDRADVRHFKQLLQRGRHDGVESTEVTSQRLGRRFSYMADTQAEQEAWQGRLLRLLQRLQDVLSRLLGHAIQAGLCVWPNRAGQLLRACGLQPGDSLAILSANSLEHAAMALGAMTVGVIAVPVGVGIGVGTGVPIVTSVVTAVI